MRLDRILNRKDDPCCRQEQDNYDEHRDDGPCQLDLVASVHLRRFRGLISARAIANNDIAEQTRHEEKDGSGYDEDQDRQVADLNRRRGRWRKDVHVTWGRRILRENCGWPQVRKNAQEQSPKPPCGLSLKLEIIGVLSPSWAFMGNTQTCTPAYRVSEDTVTRRLRMPHPGGNLAGLESLSENNR